MKALDSITHHSAAGGPSFPLANRVFRVLWGAAWLVLASWTPRPLHKWRVLLLRLFGADVSWSARVYPSARIWYPPLLRMGPHSVLGPGVTCYCMAEIEIGERATVSQGAHLCAGTHLVDDPNFQLVTRPIAIERFAWVAAEAFVGPGVRVAEGAVLGARGAAFRSLQPWTIYSGNPAQALRPRRWPQAPAQGR
jgi:putative colanic acid biosynthesis acetyltransferase WcaF